MLRTTGPGLSVLEAEDDNNESIEKDVDDEDGLFESLEFRMAKGDHKFRRNIFFLFKKILLMFVELVSKELNHFAWGKGGVPPILDTRGQMMHVTKLLPRQIFSMAVINMWQCSWSFNSKLRTLRFFVNITSIHHCRK